MWRNWPTLVANSVHLLFTPFTVKKENEHHYKKCIHMDSHKLHLNAVVAYEFNCFSPVYMCLQQLHFYTNMQENKSIII